MNKNIIFIFKVLVFKDTLRKMSFFLYLISRFSFYTYFQEKTNQFFFDLSLFSGAKCIPFSGRVYFSRRKVNLLFEVKIKKNTVNFVFDRLLSLRKKQDIDLNSY